MIHTRAPNIILQQLISLQKIVYIVLLTGFSCSEREVVPAEFGDPQRVEVQGYNDDIMEPFLSHDGAWLLFNNLNQSPVNTNLFYASRVDDDHFVFEGEVEGVNTGFLEGTPTMDENNELYFVSTRSYNFTLSTIHAATFSAGMASNVVLLDGVSRNESLWVNFDVGVSPDGSFLLVVDGLFDAYGGPYEADLILVNRTGNDFSRSADQSLLERVNTMDLEYGACISRNGLELYFTRVPGPITSSSVPRIYLATRKAKSEPFGEPVWIQAITGTVEAPALSADESQLYFHKLENGKFVLYHVAIIRNRK